MRNTTRVLTNVGIVSIVAILFAGCSLIPGGNKMSPESIEPVTAESESYTELSEDESLETIEAELDATLIEDEDFADLETDLEL